ncbi:MAG: metallophosphoesterase [Actinobacteria bacterium]|nr:MAG: metallophosphoesterase [Actinomycetota bacterium]
MIRIIADVHGAAAALRRLAQQPGPLLVLGDLINFIDYRTNEGIVSIVSGAEAVAAFVRLRTDGRHEEAGLLWREHARGREAELRAAYDREIGLAYTEICEALAGIDAYVTYGNVDRPDMLQRALPAGVRFVDAEVVVIDGIRVGFAGGGLPKLGTPGEVSDDEMRAKLDALGPVDMLCTHVPPALDPLASDVVAGLQKGSQAVLDYLRREQPPFHYFGDIHQPQALTWRIGRTVSTNVGYFRATGRAVNHG